MKLPGMTIVPKILFLIILLFGTLMLDGLAYGFFHTCPACTSYAQYILTPQAASSPLLASLAAIFSLTSKPK